MLHNAVSKCFESVLIHNLTSIHYLFRKSDLLSFVILSINSTITMASEINPIDRKAFPVIPAYAQCIILNKAPMTTSIIAKKK